MCKNEGKSCLLGDKRRKMRYNFDMNAYAEHNKTRVLGKWDLLVAALVVVVVTACLLTVLLPRESAATVTVYVDGKAVSTLALGQPYNPVATYSGVQVRVNGDKLETVYRGRVATLSRKGDKIIYPTLGVVVELT